MYRYNMYGWKSQKADSIGRSLQHTRCLREQVRQVEFSIMDWTDIYDSFPATYT